MSEEEGDGAETMPLSELSPFRTDDDGDGDGGDDVAEAPAGCLEGVRFPIETVEQLDQLERLVRTCEIARDRYVSQVLFLRIYWILVSFASKHLSDSSSDTPASTAQNTEYLAQ